MYEISPALKGLFKGVEKYLKTHWNSKNMGAEYDERIEGKRINEVIFQHKNIFFDISGQWKKIEDESLTTKFLTDFCIEVGNIRGERFNSDHPSLATELPNPYSRYRVQALGSSVLYGGGITICIRIPNDERYPLESFVLGDKVKEHGFDYEKLKSLIIEKKNVLVSGGTGSGKTSFLNSLLGEINLNDRIVTIEDSKELLIENDNRTEILISKQGKGMSYEDAINSAMRLRPDRIFLGEIDTRNTLTFLRLANTGHDGMVSTLHANTAESAIEALITNSKISSNTNIESDTLKDFIKTGIDYIIQLKTIKTKLESGEVIMRKGVHEILDLKGRGSI